LPVVANAGVKAECSSAATTAVLHKTVVDSHVGNIDEAHTGLTSGLCAEGEIDSDSLQVVATISSDRDSC